MSEQNEKLQQKSLNEEVNEAVSEDEVEQQTALESEALKEDENPVKEEKVVTAQGLDAEQYDVSKPWVDGEKVEEEDELHGIEIKYDLAGEEVKKALKVFQRKTIFKKNLIYTAVLAILFLLYLQMLFKDPGSTVAKILAPLCIAVIGFIWYLPARHIKATAQAVELNNDTFRIEICTEGILLNEQSGKYLISYNKPTTKCIELKEIFVICVSQKQVFAIPKRCIPADQIDEVKRLLKEGLRDKYEVIDQ